MPDTTELLQQGIALAKAGRRDEARTVLMQVVEQDERNESAWLWLSGVVDSDDDKAVALENVLTLNPNNEWARRGLQMLGRPLPGE
jgi:Flp pilus assembly protein TadD